MPYEQGNVSTSSGLLSVIGNFLVGQCNWNLHDDISGNDKVYFSTGSSGQEKIYARLTLNLKDRNCPPQVAYWQNQEYPGARFQHINVRMSQYWNNSTHAGTNEIQGKTGPWLWYFPSGAQNNMLATYLTPNKNSTAITTWVYPHIDYYSPWAFGNDCTYDGNSRNMYTLSENTSYSLAKLDLLYKTYYSLVNITGGSYGWRPIVAPSDTGNACVYLIRTSSGVTNPWVRRNLDGTNLITLANPPAGGGIAYDCASLTYDGGDYIYMNQGEVGSTGFYRYQISTNSWTTLAALTAGSGTDHTQNRLVYVPKTSAVGIANSWTTDRIYWKPPHTGASTLYYYSVGSNTWSTATASGATFNDNSYGPWMMWNGQDYLYASAGTTSSLRAYHLGTGVWSAIDNLPAYSNYGGSFHCLDTYQNSMSVDTAGSTYWLFGNQNRLSVVLKDSVSVYRFFYFGILDSYYSTQKVTTTSNVNAGSNVVLTVSGQFDQFVVGQPLYIVNPSSGGNAQRFSCTATGVNTITASSLGHNYSSGSIIGVDPQPVVMLCNNWDSVFVLHGPDGPGAYGATNNPLSTNVMQNLIPNDPKLNQASLPGRRGHYQLWPVAVGMWSSFANARLLYNSIERIHSWNSQNPPKEIRGQLDGVYTVNTATAPDPVGEDEIKVGNDTYILFRCTNIFDTAQHGVAYTLAVGPK